ncbi:hypothetical protein ABWH92_11190 [Ahrensia marina]|uniref:hypothetical protein n=1 Tax=Ahrensia marina TaxID=1514904 RepID=UPI0035D06298
MRFLTVALVLLASTAALAQGRVLTEYTTRIGPQDKVNSLGDRLETAAAILRQDRANYHRFDQADAEDEGDDVFDDRRERGRFERLMSRGVVQPDTARAIINGTPLVRVTVYATRMDVEIIEP